jgi:hypothetical protein
MPAAESKDSCPASEPGNWGVIISHAMFVGQEGPRASQIPECPLIQFPLIQFLFLYVTPEYNRGPAHAPIKATAAYSINSHSVMVNENDWQTIRRIWSAASSGKCQVAAFGLISDRTTLT